MKKNRFYIVLVLSLITLSVQAQGDFGPINAGVANFLLITPDARSAAMGGAGVALTGSDNAIFHNGATVLFDDSRKGGVSYTFAPWMRAYESGYSLNSVAGYYKINQQNALLVGFRYYNYPKLTLTEEGGSSEIHPKEMAFDIGYARELTANLSLSATFRYIHSDMGTIEEAKSSGAVAFDIGALYKRSLPCIQGATWALGLQVANIGSKINYFDTKESLPALAKLGGAVELPFLSIHRLAVAADLGYRFQPSDVASLQVSAGAEYILMDHFLFRGGYHYGDKKRGDTSYTTAGLGACLRGAHLDFSWLFAESDSPLKDFFWTSISFSF